MKCTLAQSGMYEYDWTVHVRRPIIMLFLKKHGTAYSLQVSTEVINSSSYWDWQPGGWIRRHTNKYHEISLRSVPKKCFRICHIFAKMYSHSRLLVPQLRLDWKSRRALPVSAFYDAFVCFFNNLYLCIVCFYDSSVFTRAMQPFAACRQSPSSQLFLAPTTLADSVRGARSPHSHYDVILVMTSFATDLATPSVTDVTYVRTDGHLTAFNI